LSALVANKGTTTLLHLVHPLGQAY